MFLKIIKFLWVAFIFGFLTLITFITSVAYNWGNLYGELPSLDVLENPTNNLASELYSADGILLGKYFRENRSPVEYEDLSENLIKALKATEDERFEKHAGIDLEANLRVLFKSVILRQDAGGGSTLSQQTAKNLFKLRRDDRYQGLLSGTFMNLPAIKAKEWITAVQIEKAYTKREILTMYLNTVDFGSNAFGIKVAAKTFFNTTPDKLALHEAAVLVGLLKAPTLYNPLRNPENSKKRRNVVFGQMLRSKYITQSQHDSLTNLPLGVEVGEFSAESHNTGLATYFRQEVGEEVKKLLKEIGEREGKKFDLYGDGLKIYTTIDSRMQIKAEEALTAHVKKMQETFFKVWKGKNPWVDDTWKEIPNYLENEIRKTEHYRLLKEKFEGDSVKIYEVLRKPVPMRVFTWLNDDLEMDTVLSPLDSMAYYAHFLHAGMMAMEPSTGHIKAWVGGINYKYFKFDHVRANGMFRRQPGSTFKPFIYAAAIDKGLFTHCSKVLDVARTIVVSEKPYKTWTAKNSYGYYTNQEFTLRQAIAQSINSVAAYLIDEVTPAEAVRYCKEVFGIKSPLEAVSALSLGVGDVSVYEMVGAYATFANKGYYIEPAFITKIEDRNGKVIYQYIPKTKQGLREETAYLMLHMLKGPTEERGGTATGLYRYKFRNGNDVGGKTGTTSNYSDGWFMGLTKDLVVGTWSGCDDRRIHFRSINEGQGARMAMPIFGAFMEAVYADERIGLKKGTFPKPVNFDIELDCDKFWKTQHNKSDSLPVQLHNLGGKTDVD